MSAGAIDAGRANITLALDAKGLQAGLNAAAQSVEQTAGAMSANGAQIAGAFGAAGKAAELFDARTGKALGQLTQKLGPAVAMVDKLWSAIATGATASAAQIGGVTTALNAQAGALGRVAAGAKAAAASLAAMAKANPVMAGAAVGVGGFALGRWIASKAWGDISAPDLQDTATKNAARENEYADALDVTIARLDLLAKKTRLTADERQRAAQLIGQLEQAGVGGYALGEGGVTATGGAADAVTARRIAAQQAIIEEQSRNRAALQATMSDLTSNRALWNGQSQEELDALQKQIVEAMTAAAEKQLAAAKEIARLKGEGVTAAKAALDAEKKAADAEKKAAEEAAKNAAELAKMRAALDKAGADVDAAAQRRDESRALAAGEVRAADLAETYAGDASTARGRASDILAALEGLDRNSEQFKQLAADYADAIKDYQSASARAAELAAQAQAEKEKAFNFSRGGVAALDAERGLAAAGRDVGQAIAAAKATGDLGALESMKAAADEFVAGAREAAQSARELAAADGVITDAEEKRVAGLEAVYAAAAGQVEALADALETTTAKAQKMGITGGGGTDAQAVFSRAMADAMKNSKSEEYQRKTADATGKMADYLSKLKGKALTFE